ncbi:MAG: hypothetical protein WC956_10605 [bacterium]
MKSKINVLEMPCRLFWTFMALATAAAIVFSFGCSSGGSGAEWLSSTEGGGGETGGTDGGGGTGGGEGLTEITITSTLSKDTINENINPDDTSLATITFSQPIDKDAAIDYINVYLQQFDGSLIEVPLTLYQQDAQTIELNWPAAYDSIYLVELLPGLKSVDLTSEVMEMIQYQIHTMLRNPRNIDGDAAGTADVAAGNRGYNDGAGAGFVLLGSELFSRDVLRMPLQFDIRGQLNPDFYIYPVPIYTDPNRIRTAVGLEAQNLGNVSGDWRADCAFSAKEPVGQPFCARGECIAGTCIEYTGTQCGCKDGDTCNPDLERCYAQMVFCDNDAGCAEGYYCDLDYGICVSDVCGGSKCGGWPAYCDNGVAPPQCAVAGEACPQPMQTELLYWDNITSPEPTAVFASGALDPTLVARSVGDVNGDGKSDFIVVETVNDQMGPVQMIYLFLGRDVFSGTIALGNADASWTPYEEQGIEPGGLAAVQIIAVAPIADFNGDGMADFAIGSIVADFDAGSVRGQVTIHYGSTDIAALKAADARISSGIDLDGFGASIAGGDVNHDGKADLLVGAPAMARFNGGGGPIIPVGDVNVIPGLNFIIGPPQQGQAPKAYLFNGAAGLSGNVTIASAAATFTGEVTAVNDGFGMAVAIADMTGDGRGDIAVAAPYHANPRGYGRVYIFHGSDGLTGPVGTSAADVMVTHDWPSVDTGFDNLDYALGVSMQPAGDINNDGYKDIMIDGVTFSRQMGQLQDAYACIFLGGPALSDANLDCDNASAIVWNLNLPATPMGGEVRVR